MNTTTIRPSTLRRAAVAALALTALGVGASQAVADDSPVRAASSGQVAGPAAGSGTDSGTDSPVAVDVEKGIVLEGTATIDGQEAFITVYDNSKYGSSINVVVGDPENGGYFGYAEQSTPYVVDGRLDATLDLDGRTATLVGSLVESGKPTRINDSMDDAGQRIVTRGTNTPLRADVTLAVDGEAVAVEAGTVFAYDLEVRKIDLYGN